MRGTSQAALANVGRQIREQLLDLCSVCLTMRIWSRPVPTKALPLDATIDDVRDSLERPDEYVRVVLGNMSACRRKHGNAHVRIGVTGAGKVPYHKITYQYDKSEQLYDAFDGVSPFAVAPDDLNWSTKSMSFDDVRNLLGEIRGFGSKV